MPTVLIVDDSQVDCHLAGACVEQSGSTAIYAGNGREALDILDRGQPDMILTDLQMPEMDGLELVKQVRNSHPKVPVILMTAHGSEDTAVEALRAGAVSYVPKKNLKQNLGEALRVVFSSVDAAKERDQVRQFLQISVTYFVLGYEPHGHQALISFLESSLLQLNFCDEGGLTRVSTALVEALTNARDHGNLELDSALRESGDNSYEDLGQTRSRQTPYCDRRVHVTLKLNQSEAIFVVRDDGSGFDVSALPDPTDPENLLKPSGRGIMLIHTFMDGVSFNDMGNEITMTIRAG